MVTSPVSQTQLKVAAPVSPSPDPGPALVAFVTDEKHWNETAALALVGAIISPMDGMPQTGWRVTEHNATRTVFRATRHRDEDGPLPNFTEINLVVSDGALMAISLPCQTRYPSSTDFYLEMGLWDDLPDWGQSAFVHALSHALSWSDMNSVKTPKVLVVGAANGLECEPIRTHVGLAASVRKTNVHLTLVEPDAGVLSEAQNANHGDRYLALTIQEAIHGPLHDSTYDLAVVRHPNSMDDDCKGAWRNASHLLTFVATNVLITTFCMEELHEICPSLAPSSPPLWPTGVLWRAFQNPSSRLFGPASNRPKHSSIGPDAWYALLERERTASPPVFPPCPGALPSGM